MKYSYTLTDKEIEGVTKSLELYNNSMPQEIPNPDYVEAVGNPTLPDPNDETAEIPNPDYVEAKGPERIPNPNLIISETKYLDFVFANCFASYRNQFNLDA